MLLRLGCLVGQHQRERRWLGRVVDSGLSHSIRAQAVQSSGWTAAVVMAPVGMVVIEIDRVGRIAAMVNCH